MYLVPSIVLFIEEPGSPPGSIKYVVSPENSATLSWNKPSLPNGNITVSMKYIRFPINHHICRLYDLKNNDYNFYQPAKFNLDAEGKQLVNNK